MTWIPPSPPPPARDPAQVLYRCPNFLFLRCQRDPSPFDVLMRVTERGLRNCWVKGRPGWLLLHLLTGRAPDLLAMTCSSRPLLWTLTKVKGGLLPFDLCLALLDPSPGSITWLLFDTSKSTPSGPWGEGVPDSFWLPTRGHQPALVASCRCVGKGHFLCLVSTTPKEPLTPLECYT